MRAPVLSVPPEARLLPAWQEQMATAGTTPDLLPALYNGGTNCCPALASTTPSFALCRDGCAGHCNGSGNTRWLA